MNKGQLIDAIAFDVNGELTKKQIDTVLTLTLAHIMSAVSDGDKVTLVGFGTFEARDRQEREGRNPKTGEIIKIPACKAVGFSAGKQFKDLVNGN